MTTLTWIYLCGAIGEVLIVIVAFFGLRAYRAKFRRQHLLPFMATGAPWLMMVYILGNTVFSIFFLASLVGIYAPCIYWMLKSPNDNPVA